MASLENTHAVKAYAATELKLANQTVIIWHIELTSASDTIIVPGLESTTSVGSCSAGITVTAGALTEGRSTLTIAGGSAGSKAIIATAHRIGFKGNLSRDEDPT